MKQIILKKNTEFSIIQGHPWVYKHSIKTAPKNLKTGEPVEVLTHKEKFAAYGIADVDSPIFVRLFPSQNAQDIHKEIEKLIFEATETRRFLFRNSDTTAWRAINGEGDGISGLIVDLYGDTMVLQLYTLALEPYKQTIIASLRKAYPEVKHLWQTDKIRIIKSDGPQLLYGKDKTGTASFKENGMLFEADLINGQKTGFFLDQRDNRQLIREVSENKKVLNICGYTGAFTVAAAYGKACETVTVDISAPALQEAEKNMKLNGFSSPKHSFEKADMFNYLEEAKENSFDIVITDPPSMAKNAGERLKAGRAYRKLAKLAAKTTKPGGFMFAASCTSQISRQEFSEALLSGITSAGKRAVLLKESYHAGDHPVLPAHKEGLYLKGMLFKIYEK